jgi:hypothetical protein
VSSAPTRTGRWPRRTVLAAAAAAVAPRTAPSQPQSRTVAVGPTMAASAFLDTIGVGAHWDYKDTTYGTRTREVVDALVRSGIRHVRGYDPVISRQLAERGILATLVAGPEVGTPEQIADTVQAANRSRRVIDAVEGPNEGDLFWPKNNRSYGGKGFPAGVIAYQRDLYRAIKKRRTTADVVVIGPSLGKSYAPDAGQPNPFPNGSLTGAVDWGNFHPYPFGGNSFSLPFPYGTIERYYWHGNFPSVNIDEYPYNRLVYAPPFQPKPMAATETGYYTGAKGVSEAVHARYVPRLFAEYARLGVRRTYLYELADVASASTDGGMEAHFGLLRADATPKPAFTALRSLLSLIARDARDDVDPVRPDISIEPAMPPGYDRTQFVHSLLLQKSRSRFLLLQWHEVASADTSAKPPREIAVPAGSATIVLPSKVRATSWYGYGDAWNLEEHRIGAGQAGGRLDVPLRDDIVAVALVLQE